MCSGKVQVFAEVMDEQESGWNIIVIRFTVNRDRNFHVDLLFDGR